jgi:transcriptional regulator with AAA-type ATPase domain
LRHSFDAEVETMPLIPHVMVLDDDPRVLESLVPGLAHDVARALGKIPAVDRVLRLGEPAGATGPLQVRVTAHGFESERLAAYRHRSPVHLHLHLVRERDGRFDQARRLLNDQLFAVVVSDLRFSDDAGGQRAGQLFIDEATRAHPEIQGLLYSAYPRPEGFPADQFVRKGGEPGSPGLEQVVARATERYLTEPAIAALAEAVADQGLIYQSDAFGTILAQLFGLARLMGVEQPSRGQGRVRRPLPCVLLDGESGTGKRGLAAVFHAASNRRDSPMAIASCNELTNETLLRGILFGHKRGAFTDAREDRAGLVVSAGKGVVLLDDFHRLPVVCSAILHSFLEDGEFTRLGEEEVRRHADSAVVLTVETQPWLERRRSGELPLAFLARVERLPLRIPPLRERPEDVEAQARWLARVVAAELGTEIELSQESIERLREYPFTESNSRELRNILERAVYRHHRETDILTWAHIEQFMSSTEAATAPSPGAPAFAAAPFVRSAPTPAPNEWQRRLRALAAKILTKGAGLSSGEAGALADALFDQILPETWATMESARSGAERPSIPLPVWEDVWRCFAVSWLGGPSPAEKSLGIPANTLRQWINDRESR